MIKAPFTNVKGRSRHPNLRSEPNGQEARAVIALMCLECEHIRDGISAKRGAWKVSPGSKTG